MKNKITLLIISATALYTSYNLFGPGTCSFDAEYGGRIFTIQRYVDNSGAINCNLAGLLIVLAVSIYWINFFNLFKENIIILKRLPQLMFGLFLCGFGLAFTIEANLGLNSWDVFHDGFSKLINVKIGFAGVVTGFILLLGWVPLKQKPFIGTILNILTIGNVIDLTMLYLPSPEDMLYRIAFLIFGTFCFAIGVGVYVGSGLGPGPRDGIMVGISRLGPSIRVTRIGIDFTAFILGVLLGGSFGLGTVFMVVSVGPVVQYSLKKFDKGAIFSL